MESKNYDDAIRNDNVFVEQIKDKLERITNRDVEIKVEEDDPNYFEVDFDRMIPQVVMGRNIYEYSGFARMCIEYASASIIRSQHIGEMEFHILLSRN